MTSYYGIEYWANGDGTLWKNFYVTGDIRHRIKIFRKKACLDEWIKDDDYCIFQDSPYLRQSISKSNLRDLYSHMTNTEFQNYLDSLTP